MHVAATAAEPLKFRKADFVAGDGLAINQTGGRLERVQCLDNQWEPLGPIVPVSREKPHPLGTPPRQQAEAIVLNLMNPVAASRWPLDRNRQARLNKIGEGTQTPQHRAVMQHGMAGVESVVGKARLETRARVDGVIRRLRITTRALPPTQQRKKSRPMKVYLDNVIVSGKGARRPASA